MEGGLLGKDVEVTGRFARSTCLRNLGRYHEARIILEKLVADDPAAREIERRSWRGGSLFILEVRLDPLLDLVRQSWIQAQRILD